MKFCITSEIADRYPQLRIAVVKGYDLKPKNEKVLRELEARRALFSSNFLEKFPENSTLVNNVCIKSWRDAYQSFGAKPSKYKPSAERLFRRIIKGDQIHDINPIVDCYLLSQLIHLLPVGGYDIEKVSGDILLRFSSEEEPFNSLSEKEEKTKIGEVVYSDDNTVLTRRWNYIESDAAKIDSKTKDIILMSEAPYSAISDEMIELSLETISSLYVEFFDGRIEKQIMNVSKGELEWAI